MEITLLIMENHGKLMEFVFEFLLETCKYCMIAVCYFSYESSIGKDPEKEKVKPHFSQTIMFVEDYFNLVSQDG